MGESILTPKYPYDIAYNVARVGKWYFHNLKYTDRRIRNTWTARHRACPRGTGLCQVFDTSRGRQFIITTDRGIERAAAKKGIDVLYVECGDSIRLPGLDRGFIGGACGMISDTVCAINGSVEKLKGSDPIISFLSSRNMTIVQLSDECVTDIGSIIPLALADPSN